MNFIENTIISYILVGILGLFLGALANTYILQWLSEEIPKEIAKDTYEDNEEELNRKLESIQSYQRKLFEYIPFLSWIKRTEKEFSIFPRYKQIAIEIAFCSGTLLIFLSFGISKEFLLHTFALWYFTCGMICDIQTRYCPPTLHTIAFVGVIASGLFIHGLLSTFIGLAIPGLVLYAIVVAFETFLGKEVMGGGDLKMIILAGGLLGTGFAMYELVIGAAIVTVLYIGAVIRARRKGEDYSVPMMVGYGLAFVLYEELRLTPDGKLFFDLLTGI